MITARCTICGRPLTNRRSVVLGVGQCCQQTAIAEMSEEDGFAERMRGYKLRPLDADRCIVTSPAGDAYVVDRDGCDCPSRIRPCIHWRWVMQQREAEPTVRDSRTVQPETPPATRRMTQDEFEREVAIDFAEEE